MKKLLVTGKNQELINFRVQKLLLHLNFLLITGDGQEFHFISEPGKNFQPELPKSLFILKVFLIILFGNSTISTGNNQLIIRIQPDEGILLKFGMKTPGAGFDVQTVNMDFHYSDLTNTKVPAAYERLLLDCMQGDATLYATWRCSRTSMEICSTHY